MDDAAKTILALNVVLLIACACMLPFYISTMRAQEKCDAACVDGGSKRARGGCWCTTDLVNWELKYKEQD